MGLRPGTITALTIFGISLSFYQASESLKGSWYDTFERKTKDQGKFTFDGNLQGTGKLWESISAIIFENPSQDKRQKTTKETSKTAKECMIRNYLLLIALMLSGDISPNPGPVTNPCSVCFGPVGRNHKAISCDCCDKYVHIKCEGGISNKDYKTLADKGEFAFICRACLIRKHPFSELEDSELCHTVGFENTLDKNVDFTINKADVSLIKNKKGMKILHMNINGLLHKVDDVKIISQLTAFDILCLNETKLDGYVKDEDISIPGYTPYRRDRNRFGGGVAIYVSDRIEAYQMNELEDQNREAVWVKVCFKRSKPIVIGSVYRPPGKGKDLQMMEELQDYLENIHRRLGQGQELHIFGDLNCNMLKRTALSSMINDICNAIGTSQLINEPTRITERSSTLIDLILTSNVNKISESGVIHTGTSDHSLIYAIRKGRKIRAQPKVI